MTALVPTILTFIAAAAAAWLIVGWARCNAQDAASASLILDEQYQAANALIKDEATPDSIVRFVGFMSAQAAHPALARRFAWDLVRGRIRQQVTMSPHKAQLESDIRGLSPAGQGHFATVVSTSLVSSAASDPLLSRAYMLFIAVFLSSSGRLNDKSVSVDRAKTAAIDLAEGCAYA